MMERFLKEDLRRLVAERFQKAGKVTILETQMTWVFVSWKRR